MAGTKRASASSAKPKGGNRSGAPGPAAGVERSATPRDRVVLLADHLRGLLAAPPRTAAERVRYDAWKAAIEPRARRMGARVERLASARAWEYDAARRPERIRASLWPTTVREMAALYTELAGALLQHERVRVVWRQRLFIGTMKATGGGGIVTAKDEAKVRAGEKKALDDARRANQHAAKAVLDEALQGLQETRVELRALLAEVRALVAALQEAEEARLQARVRALPEDTSEREHAEDLLLDLAQGRLDAKRFGEEQSSGYGSLLRRRWLLPRDRLVRLLEG